MKKFLLAVVCAAALMTSAQAQTTTPTAPTFPALPVKATPAPVTFQYPQISGLVVALWTGGGGSSVNAAAPGIPPASLTTTTAGIGATVGWMWTPKGSPVSISAEEDVSAQNFNGNNTGFSVQGPLALEQRVMFWTSVQNVQTIFAALPSLPNPFSQISAFSIPSGFTGTGKNLLGAGFFAHEADISSAFQGVQAGKVWRANPGFAVGAVQPLTNGGAFRELLEFDWGTSKIFGQVPAGQTFAAVGNGVRARVDYAF